MKIMKFKVYIFTLILFFMISCRSAEVKEEEPDEILEEELRAEAEPIKEIKERDFREDIKKPNKKR